MSNSFSFEKERLIGQARQIAKQHGIPEDLFLKQINQESGWNPKAKSGAGALGLVQVMPSTAKAYGVSSQDLLDPIKNMDLAAKIMQKNLNTYKGDPVLALAAYNGGGGSIDFAKKELGKPNITGAEWSAFMADRRAKKGSDPKAWHTQTLNYVKHITNDTIHNIDKYIHPQNIKEVLNPKYKAPYTLEKKMSDTSGSNKHTLEQRMGDYTGDPYTLEQRMGTPVVSNTEQTPPSQGSPQLTADILKAYQDHFSNLPQAPVKPEGQAAEDPRIAQLLQEIQAQKLSQQDQLVAQAQQRQAQNQAELQKQQAAQQQEAMQNVIKLARPDETPAYSNPNIQLGYQASQAAAPQAQIGEAAQGWTTNGVPRMYS